MEILVLVVILVAALLDTADIAVAAHQDILDLVVNQAIVDIPALDLAVIQDIAVDQDLVGLRGILDLVQLADIQDIVPQVDIRGIVLRVDIQDIVPQAATADIAVRDIPVIVAQRGR